MKSFTHTLILLLLSISVSAQEGSLKIGGRIGGGISVNKGLDKILVSEDYYSNYKFSDKVMFAPTMELFMQYHKPSTFFGAEGGFTYYQKASKLEYSDNMDFHYDIRTRYNYLGISAFFKFYPWKHGLSVNVGGRIGSNLSTKGLTYKSNQEDSKFSSYQYATVSETEQIMKEKLTGRPDVSAGFGLGYEFPCGIVLDFRYFYGLTNTIKTETNDYNWIEHSNHSNNLELTFGYTIDL